MALAYDRRAAPRPAPAPGTALRLGFVGPPWTRAFALEAETASVRGAWAEDAAELAGFDPHVLVAFAPLAAPPACASVGFVLDTVPRPRKGRPQPRPADGFDTFDRVIAVDPLMAGVMPVWRSMPPPVADSHFADVAPIEARPLALFAGRSTPHREQWLADSKRFLSVTHVDRLQERSSHQVGIVLHEDDFTCFEPGICAHLAAGRLVVSERLEPTFGLEPGIDFVEVDHPRTLHDVLYTLDRFPAMHDRIRIRGRMKAELFRASTVWPRVAHDLMLDLRAFG